MREDTKNCIAKFQVKTFANVKNIERAEQFVDKNEVIHFIAPTNIVTSSSTSRKKEKFPGVVVLTNERVIFYIQLLNANHSEIFPVTEIRSIESSGNSLSGGHIILHTISKDYDILVSYKKAIMQSIQSTFENIRSCAGSNTNNCSKTISEADELVKFKNLFDQGVITEDEFNAKKKQLLGL